MVPSVTRLAVLAVVAAACLPGSAKHAGRDVAEPVCYRPPVEAPMVDPFRPPSSVWGPGNRGITYGTTPGTTVLAAARGVVSFAGPIAHENYVSVLHADGLRTTYSYVASISVWIGEPVGDRQPVGITGSTLQFGVRRGTTYLDPSTILGVGCRAAHAILVPLEGGAPG